METTYDQHKPCPRCQQQAPALKFTRLYRCLFCNYPKPDPKLFSRGPQYYVQ